MYLRTKNEYLKTTQDHLLDGVLILGGLGGAEGREESLTAQELTLTPEKNSLRSFCQSSLP